MRNLTEMLVDKIDTQGMSIPGGKINPNQVFPPMKVRKMSIYSDMERAELIDIIQEAIRTLKK